MNYEPIYLKVRKFSSVSENKSKFDNLFFKYITLKMHSLNLKFSSVFAANGH